MHSRPALASLAVQNLFRMSRSEIAFVVSIVLMITSCGQPLPEQLPAGPVEKPDAGLIDEAIPLENKTDRVWKQGWLEVPENRFAVDGRTIKVPFGLSYVADSLRVDSLPPILIMSGGPGNSSLHMLNGSVYTPWGKAHDLLVLEQRGTRYAEPCLNCPEVDSMRWLGMEQRLSTEAMYQLKQEALAQCHQRLTAGGVDLAGYHTLATVADIEALRQTLDLDQLILYGMSYSCNLMSAYARTYPERVAALIVDSPLPHQSNYEEEAFWNVDHTLQALLLHYTGSDALYHRWLAYLDEVGDATFTISYEGESYPYSRYEMIDLMLFRMSEHGQLPKTVSVIENLIAGKHEELEEIIDYQMGKGGQALGMRYSVWVSEELTEENPAAIATQAEAYPWLKGYAINDVSQQTLAVWPVRPLYDHQAWPTGNFEGPTLILSGSFDPWTPPRYGEWVKQIFPQAKHQIYPEHSHLPGFTKQGSIDIHDFIRSAGY